MTRCIKRWNRLIIKIKKKRVRKGPAGYHMAKCTKGRWCLGYRCKGGVRVEWWAPGGLGRRWGSSRRGAVRGPVGGTLGEYSPSHLEDRQDAEGAVTSTPVVSSPSPTLLPCFSVEEAASWKVGSGGSQVHWLTGKSKGTQLLRLQLWPEEGTDSSDTWEARGEPQGRCEIEGESWEEMITLSLLQAGRG